MDKEKLHELLYQSLETERGGIQIYEHAVACAQNEDLKQEWSKYLDQTTNHEVVMLRVLDAFGLDPNTETAGRTIVRQKGQMLVKSMQEALAADPAAAQLVAAECVVEAETKDHMNWELIGEAAKELNGDEAKVLKEAHEEVEEEEDEHLYHTMGWARELWLEFLGLRAVLPPPEEEKHVKTAIGAERAKQSRERML
jgi:ferritin-like metal-binding protein YciE